MQKIFCLLILSITCFSYGDHNAQPNSLFGAEDAKIISMTNEKGEQLVIGMVVSQTIKNEEQLIFCDYANLYLMNLNTGQSTILKKPENISSWYPTAVEWCQDTEQLYIANYLGKDVLVFKFDDQDNLILVTRYIDEELIGPENISVNQKDKIFAVADYDNSKVIVFNKNGKLWSRPVGRAHGIAFDVDNQFLYVSGLIPPKIYKFDFNGNLIREIGEAGWKGNKYLWPTSIMATDKNILITDAHTGKISFVDRDLNFQKAVGGNGLGISLFNMPYGITKINNDLLFVTDTFKSRILKINPHDNKIISIYQANSVFGINQNIVNNKFDKGAKWISTFQEPFGLLYKNRTNLSQKVSIQFNEVKLNNLWSPGYNYLENKSFIRLILNIMGLFSDSAYYWVVAKNFEHKNFPFTIIGSPQSTKWLLMYKGIVCPIFVGMDFWIQDNCLISSRGYTIALETLASIALEKIEIYIDSLRKGVEPLEAIEKLLGIPDFRTKFPTFFHSHKGKSFAQSFLGAKTIKEQQRFAKLFLNSITKNLTLDFCEIALASMIVYGFTE